MRGQFIKYSEAEDDIIRRFYDPYNSSKSCVQIANDIFLHYGIRRTPSAIRSKASAMGLCKARYRRWEKEEEDLLARSVGKLTVRKIYYKLRKLCRQNEWSYRSEHSVRLKLEKMGYDPTFNGIDGHYMTPTQLRKALGISEKRFSILLKEFDFMLNPEHNGKNILIHVRNIKRFIKEYPGEIARFKPDVAWLLTIAFSEWKVK